MTTQKRAYGEVGCTLRTTYRNGSTCPSPASYRVHAVDCYVCGVYAERDECRGHEVCVDHAAELRTQGVRQRPADIDPDLPPFIVGRIYGLVDAEAGEPRG